MTIKNKIKTVSLDLLIEHGIHGTSTKMITEKAEISNGALFHHFASKDDILIELYRDINIEMFDAVYHSVLDIASVRMFAHTYFKSLLMWYVSNPKKTMFLEMFSQMPSVRSCLDFIDKDKTDYVECFFAKAIENGEIIVYDYRAFLCNLLHVIDGAYVYLKGSDITSMDIDTFIEFTFNKYWRSIANF